MSWQLKLIEYTGQDARTIPVGSIWYADAKVLSEESDDHLDWPDFFASRKRLSDYYLTNNTHRLPLLVMLPKAGVFCVDSKCWDQNGMHGGWTVTGTAPLITVSPSINVVGVYHGFIQNGVLTDDCEGRTYPA